jgi:hypothetical protein
MVRVTVLSVISTVEFSTPKSLNIIWWTLPTEIHHQDLVDPVLGKTDDYSPSWLFYENVGFK